ncbi:hypothetical protein CXB51_010145 [Gossypium anomalum]|uniref:Integrase catalytic domain-containing protein n=1 Tax=Gossypium anomalum TaxID=47600 RepID=A0A8J5ZCQ7_9ROSI|nr:hypothetical protein CXB51_010145 [Gossypium anomalum]
MADKSFVVDWNKGSGSAYSAVLDESKLWHKRIGHANLQHKFKVASIFWKFKGAVDAETVCELKTLRSDNGIVYTSAMFQGFCDEAGIKHQLTNTYTPQQNGVSGRLNRSLMNMARCLLFERNLPKTLWAEVVNTVSLWIHMLSYVPVVKRDKLAKKAQPVILVGYSSVKKGYKILGPSSNRVFTEDDQDNPVMDIDDEPLRGTRALAKIYARADVVNVELNCFEEAEAHQGWKQAMLDEMRMINKNKTWELVTRLANMKAAGYLGYTEAMENSSARCKVYFSQWFFEEASRARYYRIDSYLANLGFERSTSEPTLYVKKEGKMEQMFEMSDLEQMSYFLGIEVSQTEQGIFLSQKGSSSNILNKFSMLNCKATSTPDAIGEKLSSEATRPDIMFAVSFLSRFMHCYNEKHFQAAKRVLSSNKKNVVAQSTTEAEYVAAAGAVNQAIWLRKIIIDLNLHQREATEIKSDNQSAIVIAKNLVFHERTKHFKIKFHFVREMEQAQEVKLIHCSSEDQLVDILTKPCFASTFTDLQAKLGVCIPTNDFCIHNLVNNPLIPSALAHQQWRKPSRGFIKVNFDVAISPNKTGYGMIMRNEDGFVIGGDGGFKEEELTEEWAEIFIFEESVKLAKTMNFSKAIFEIDCASLANKANRRDLDITIMGTCIKEIFNSFVTPQTWPRRYG